MNFAPHDPKTPADKLIITVWLDGNKVRWAKANGSQGVLQLLFPNPASADVRSNLIFIEFHQGNKKFTEVYTLLGERRGRINSN